MLNKIFSELSEEEQLEERVRNLLQVIYAEIKRDLSFMPAGYSKGKKSGFKHCKYALKQLLIFKEVDRAAIQKVVCMFDEFAYYFIKAEAVAIYENKEWLERYYRGKVLAFLYSKHKLRDILKEAKNGTNTKETTSRTGRAV